MKSWWSLCLVNGLILAIVARVVEVCCQVKPLRGLAFQVISIIVWLFGSNCLCLLRYRRALLRSEAFRRRVERERIYSEPYTWFRRDPNPEPLINEDGISTLRSR